MNTTVLAMWIALAMTLALVVGLGVLHLLSGGLAFLFGRPKMQLLRSQKGEGGFAFSFADGGSDKFDQVRLRLYNPFGEPTQMDLSTLFEAGSARFARDVNFGPQLKKLLRAKGIDQARIALEVSQSRGQLGHTQLFAAPTFLRLLEQADQSVMEFNEEYKTPAKAKPLYHTPKRDFIAAPLPKTGAALKLATNPAFAGEFAGVAPAAQAAGSAENFAVSKVWIDPGCIVCDACEAIYPEVFEVTDETCVIRPGAPLDDGLKIEEAAEACPVEVIKFTKA